MKLLLTGIALLSVFAVKSQHSFKAIVSGEGKSLAGATVFWKEQKRAFTTDSTGLVMVSNIPDGKQSFEISHVNFKPTSQVYHFPLATSDTVKIDLAAEEEEEAEVIVTATRTSRTIANTPTRVEVISGEELDEKANMKPGDIRMMLSESTGIQTQQTSATSYNSSIRIQGLDGRYTQILRDGFPLYSGFSGGLSIMQIAPLDLQQVEVIKGSSSTLYGGGAIAGLVNLVSKTPTNKRELNFLLNGTSAKGLDISSFYSMRGAKTGVSIFASANYASPYDPADIGLTAIPKSERYTIHPRMFFYGKRSTADIGISLITENRIGGNMDVIKNGGTGYTETNNSDRVTIQSGFAHKTGENSSFQLKNSYTWFNRAISVPGYQFEGLQQASFSEATLNFVLPGVSWVIGANILTDGFNEEQHSQTADRNYYFNTYGIFIQNAWSPSDKFTFETGIRGDYVSEYGFELLPRVSILWKPISKWTVRVGGGFGYKTPTVFTEESERLQFQNVLPIPSTAINERSIGTNFDFTYRTNVGEAGVTINQLFFYTRLNKPLILTNVTNGLEFRNANGHIDTRGMETNLKISIAHFKLFVGYTLADVNTHFDDVEKALPLTARHRLNNVLMYEVEGKWKLGLEAYYTSEQQLSDGTRGRSYWVTGFMAEKFWQKFSIFINFENFLDTRQTKFDTIFTGSIDNPVFRDIYAPVDGFVINGGIKLRL